MKFIHTADWQLGKPFAGVEDQDNRSALRSERIEAVKRIGECAREHGAEFVLVAGDLFDSPTPDNSTVAAACSAIGGMGLPVIAIPGNHDHAGPGSIWGQEFFLREKAKLAPNFILLDQREPYAAPGGAVILPCPLLRRQEASDVTAWLHDGAWQAGLDPASPRIVLAHGSTQGFSSALDDEESSAQPNIINLERLPAAEIDYIALGDWHGTKKIDEKAWYSGTPEIDRFPKGGDHNPGNILLVEIPGRGRPPNVKTLATNRIGWHQVAEHIAGDEDLDRLEQKLKATIGTRARVDLMKIELTGNLGLAGEQKLAEMLEGIKARLLRLKLDNRIFVLPSEEEIHQLAGRPGDPLIAAMAGKLVEMARAPGDEQAVAAIALRQLYAMVEGSR